MHASFEETLWKRKLGSANCHLLCVKQIRIAKKVGILGAHIGAVGYC
jgi:hypothetical protein